MILNHRTRKSNKIGFSTREFFVSARIIAKTRIIIEAVSKNDRTSFSLSSLFPSFSFTIIHIRHLGVHARQDSTQSRHVSREAVNSGIPDQLPIRE
jgi:hypothetical protein